MNTKKVNCCFLYLQDLKRYLFFNEGGKELKNIKKHSKEVRGGKLSQNTHRGRREKKGEEKENYLYLLSCYFSLKNMLKVTS